MKRRNKLKLNKRLVAALAVLLAVGFAYITSAVNIGGVFTVFKSTWDIHFDNVQVTQGSVSANPPSFNSNNPELTLAVQFTNPGDFYEFTIDAVNAGDIDGMLDTYSDLGITPEQEAYLNYSVTYEDGEALAQYQELNAGDTCTFKIRIEFRDDIPAQDLPQGGAYLDLGFDVSYVRADNNRIRRRAENTLYNVLKNEAESGGLAKKYTGSHQDSMDASLSTKDIYHWYATNNTDGTAVTNKNNVIFANHCWQLIRTTDTGGAKLIYNGEVENNQCLNTRGSHLGYANSTYDTMTTDYWYGTDYTYDSNNNVFSISGSTEKVTWDATAGPQLIGKYTCKSSNINDTCETLYLVESYYDATKAYLLALKNNSHYSQFGYLGYSNKSSSLASIGYMYNSIYRNEYVKMTFTENMLASSSLSTSYWYAHEISWNGNVYELNNEYQVSSTDDYQSLVGEYTFRQPVNIVGQNFAYYIAAVNNTTMFYIELRDSTNHKLSDYNYTYTYGSSYTDNGNGTYTINNPTTIYRSDWYTNYNNVGANKYVCKNANNNTCSDLWYTQSTSNKSMTYIKVGNNYKYSKGFTWNGNQYVLNNDNTVNFWNYMDSTNINSINNAHYTCWNSTGICTTLSYIYYVSGTTIYYINLTNGKSIDTAINEMLYDNNVNTNNSCIKSGIDAWYKKYLLSYDNYIEDTIFCNDRRIQNKNGWNPNGGTVTTKLQFIEYNATSDLACANNTDKFSISNPSATLTYKIGLLSSPEMNIINNSKARITGNLYWLSSPYDVFTISLDMRIIYDTGVLNDYETTGGLGLRFSISLSPSTVYTSGNGSMETPYVIYTE